MVQTTKHFITVQNKKYMYALKKVGKDTIFFECTGACIAQKFLNEDIPELLIDLPNLILAQKKYEHQQSEMIRFRVSSDDKRRIEKKAIQRGYNSISGYLRDLALQNREC